MRAPVQRGFCALLGASPQRICVCNKADINVDLMPELCWCRAGQILRTAAYRVACRADGVAQVHERVTVAVREHAGDVNVVAGSLALRMT